MALSTYEVVGRTLIMSHGLTLQVGERIGLDPARPEHASMIERGWVRKYSPSSSIDKNLAHQPNKQVRKRHTRRKTRHE
jgi:hypothetical protein